MSLGNCKLKQQDTTAHLLEKSKFKTLTTPNAEEDAEQQELSSLLLEMQNGKATLEDRFAVFCLFVFVFLIILNILLPYIPAITLLGVNTNELKTYVDTKSCTCIL